MKSFSGAPANMALHPNVADTSLILRKKCDAGEQVTPTKALELLKESRLVQRLTAEECTTPLSRVWRLIALSEIPFSGHLAYTRALVNDVEQGMFAGEAFSLTGKLDGVLPCYNAMITKALFRIAGSTKSVEAGIAWILKYQPMCRGTASCWGGRSTRKYGGCFKATPCYIGVAKSLAALQEFAKTANSTALDTQLKQGLEYVWEHGLVYRQSNGEPITAHILDISFPESYQLNIVDLVQLFSHVAPEGLSEQRAVRDLLSKRSAEGYWKINHVYKASGYLAFDTRGKPGEWVSHVLNTVLDKQNK